MDFEIQFTDITILEANGEYNEVCAAMKRPVKNGVVDNIIVDDWMVASEAILQNPFGFAQFNLHFFHDGSLLIADYTPTVKDVHNPDLICLGFWAQSSGWKRPEPTPALIETWQEYFHHNWETSVIESRYFDQKFGQRRFDFENYEDAEELDEE